LESANRKDKKKNKRHIGKAQWEKNQGLTGIRIGLIVMLLLVNMFLLDIHIFFLRINSIHGGSHGGRN
jgi:hypothetical protein